MDEESSGGKWVNRGSRKIRQNPRLAKEIIGKGLKINPYNGIGWYNLGIALHQDKKISAAIKSYRLALKQGGSKELECYAKNNLAQDLLLNEEWQEGFELYENRFRRDNTDYQPYINMFGKAWSGYNDPRECKKLMVISEQGFGDTIQFIRLLKNIKEKGIETSFFGPEELRQLMRKGTNLGPFPSLLSNEDEGTRWCTLLSLPQIVGLTPKTIPLKDAYIKPDSKMVAKWKNIIRRKPNKKLIAIHWQGNVKFEKSIYVQGRSMPFEVLQKLNDLKDVEYLSLQKGKSASKITKNNILPMVSGQDEFSKSMSFEDTAAAIACCDLVISADSSVVHLAGAMGTPVWIALSWVPEWRWGVTGTNTRWYDSAYLFRQKKWGEWEQVIEEIKEKFRSDRKEGKI